MLAFALWMTVNDDSGPVVRALDVCLNHLRKYYPDELVCIFEGGSDQLRPLSKTHGCTHFVQKEPMFRFGGRYVEYAADDSWIQMAADLYQVQTQSGAQWVLKLGE